MNTILKYQSGEEIRKGDRVLFHGEPAVTELIAVDKDDSEQRWYVEQHGGGILIREPKVFGHAFIHADQLEETEDLVFISRAARLPANDQ